MNSIELLYFYSGINPDSSDIIKKLRTKVNTNDFATLNILTTEMYPYLKKRSLEPQTLQLNEEASEMTLTPTPNCAIEKGSNMLTKIIEARFMQERQQRDLENISKYILNALEECREATVEHCYSFYEEPIHYIMHSILQTPFGQGLEFAPGLAAYLSDFICHELELLKIDKFYFIECALGYTGTRLNTKRDTNLFVDLLLARKRLYDVLEFGRIDVFEIDDSAFMREKERFSAFVKLEESTLRFDKLISCRRCKKFTITLQPLQTSLKEDELQRYKAICRDPNCLYRFIV